VSRKKTQNKKEAHVLIFLKYMLAANDPRAQLLAGCEPKLERKKEAYVFVWWLEYVLDANEPC